MTLTLDATTEERIQHEIALGHYADPAEVVADALARLVEARASAQQSQSMSNAESKSGRAAIDEAFGLWAGRGEDGLAYQKRMRDEW